jgi:hypothetical protein
MATIGRRTMLIALASAAAQGQSGGDWVSLFDGKTLEGWKETDFSDHGTVRVDGGSIILGRGYLTGITWKGDFPKSGYEIRFEAVRMEGSDFFAGITFPVGDSHCTWINGGWGGTIVGLSNLDGYDASENETSTPYDFVKGRWYSFRLLVTTEFIHAWIDNSMVVSTDIRGRRVDLRFGEIDLNKPLGFAAYSTTAGLRKIEYRTIPTSSK